MVIVQVTVSPSARVSTFGAMNFVAPGQDHVPAYPPGPDSDRVYVPAATGAEVTAGAPVMPVIPVLPVTPGVGPVAVSIQSRSMDVPPKTLWTILTSVRCAARSELATVQVAA